MPVDPPGFAGIGQDRGLGFMQIRIIAQNHCEPRHPARGDFQHITRSQSGERFVHRIAPGPAVLFRGGVLGIGKLSAQSRVLREISEVAGHRLAVAGQRFLPATHLPG